MKYVYSYGKTNLLTIDEAFKQGKSCLAWRCAQCREPVRLQRTGKKVSMAHVTKGCDGVFQDAEKVLMTRRLAALLQQNWTVSAGVDAENGKLAGAELLEIERLAGVVLPDCSATTALVQLARGVALVGVVASREDMSTLTATAKKFGCAALAVPLKETSWGQMKDSLLSAELPKTAWLVPMPTSRLTFKKALFERIRRACTYGLGTMERKKALAFDPKVAASRLQFLQDMTATARQNRWPKYLKKAVFGSGPRSRWTDWFVSNVRPVELPTFWLRFWVMQNALKEEGLRHYPKDLAMDLASIFVAENEPAQDRQDLADELEEVVGALLDELAESALLKAALRRNDNGTYTCLREVAL